MNVSQKYERSVADKVALFRSYFSGLTNLYGTYDPATGRSWQVKEAVTNKTILAHLQGRNPYGVYLLTQDRTRAIAVDFDDPDASPPIAFVNRAEHYSLPAYIETSKSKGYHVWIFFEEKGVLASKARLVVNHILAEIEYPDTEVFPKQDCLDMRASFGNFINAPLFGRLVPLGKTVFVDPNTLEPYPDQWDLLETVLRTDESALHDIIEINDLKAPQNGGESSSRDALRRISNRYSLPPCARRILRDGVSQYQRVSCFRLAVHLKRLGLPFDLAVAVLKVWALKIKPRDGKGVIRDSEIVSQASYAYEGSYLGYGCSSEAVKPFCEASCSVKEWKESNRRTPLRKKEAVWGDKPVRGSKDESCLKTKSS